MDIVDITRYGLVVGYLCTAAYSGYMLYRTNLTSTRLVAIGGLVIAIVWGGFYIYTGLIDDLTDQLRTLQLMVRLNHLPVITYIIVLLWTRQLTEESIERLNKGSRDGDE